MATYDEDLNIIEDVNVDNFPQYQNIKYNIGSIRKHTGELKDYFAKIFDKSTGISGSITYVLTPDDMLVEHYNPKTKNVTFEQIQCFYFNNVVIKMTSPTDNKISYLKYYKLQKYQDIIESNPNASHNLNANGNSHRFVYTCQKVGWKILEDKTGIYGLVLNGYYGINGWELLVQDLDFNPLNCYKFQKDGESKKLFNPEYYKLTKKTNKLEKLSESILNLQTRNTIQQVKFPGFYVNNKSFIRFANQLTSDTTEYKIKDNKDVNNNDVLPTNSDNLGYEDLKNSKIILFNGFDNNYELKNIKKTDDNIQITYQDWTQNGKQVMSDFQLKPKDKIYIVKRESSTVDYDNNNIYTSASHGPYNINSGAKYEMKPKDFVYTLAFDDPRICFTGPTIAPEYNVPSIDPSYINQSCSTLYLKFNSPILTGTYVSNSTDTLDNLNFIALTLDYQNAFIQKSYSQEITIDNSASYGNIIFDDGNFKWRNLEFISKNKNMLVSEEFKISNIKINIDGSIWNWQDGVEPIFNNFTVNSSEVIGKSDCLSIVSAINNKPGMLPNYINLLSEVDTTIVARNWLDDLKYYTLKDMGVSVSNNILMPLTNTTNNTHYDLMFQEKSYNKPLFLRFGFESKTYTPSTGYLVIIELNN